MSNVYKIRIILIFFLITSTINLKAQTDSIRMFILGQSLIDHRPLLISTPSNETTVPHWLYLLAQTAGHAYAGGGQYGFLPHTSHGGGTIYFIANLITYMAICEKKAPLNYIVPTIIDSTVRNNYTTVVHLIWNELQAFNDNLDTSQVFCPNSITTGTANLNAKISTEVFWFPNPTTGKLQLSGLEIGNEIFVIDSYGRELIAAKNQDTELLLNTSRLRAGLYVVKIRTPRTEKNTIKKLIKVSLN